MRWLDVLSCASAVVCTSGIMVGTWFGMRARIRASERARRGGWRDLKSDGRTWTYRDREG